MTRTDPLLDELARFALATADVPEQTQATARLALADSLGCSALASADAACRRMLGPQVEGAAVVNGARVPATPYQLDPVEAAFQTGALIRWLDFNDTWLAAEWGHPSDNFGAILALGDYLARRGRHVAVDDLLRAAVTAYEIQGVLALDNAFNAVALDHVILVKVASTAAACRLLGASHGQAVAALSNAWVDGHPLRTYRHSPNTGPRKSWAAGDASARGLRLALLAVRGEPAYPSALSAPTWGFQDALFRGREVRLARPLGTYVVDNILFKLVPAEFHAQTAAECALRLHAVIGERTEQIERIEIRTQNPALRIIDKTGPLRNSADRDHSLQYVTAVSLLYGKLTAWHYSDEVAADPRIDRLRDACVVTEEPRYSADYLDPEKRSVANAVRIVFADGSEAGAEVEYPLGHPRRRREALPLLREKLHANLATAFAGRAEALVELLLDDEGLLGLRADALLDALAT